MDSQPITKILCLSANPKNSTRLRLDEELREIDEGLRRATHRNQFELTQKWAVRPKDLQRAILDLSPRIVHFSGHGLGTVAGEPSAQGVRDINSNCKFKILTPRAQPPRMSYVVEHKSMR